MSRKQRKHIRGKRGEKFLQIVRGIDRARILCVSLDISKYFHLVMMHNAYGEIVTPSFEIDMATTLRTSPAICTPATSTSISSTAWR
jgi:hypothetical protein